MGKWRKRGRREVREKEREGVNGVWCEEELMDPYAVKSALMASGFRRYRTEHNTHAVMLLPTPFHGTGRSF